MYKTTISICVKNECNVIVTFNKRFRYIELKDIYSIIGNNKKLIGWSLIEEIKIQE